MKFPLIIIVLYSEGVCHLIKVALIFLEKAKTNLFVQSRVSR